MDVRTPSNAAGDEVPLSGSAYAGLFTYVDASVWREYARVQLTSPLVAGTTYAVSFNASCAENHNLISCPTNNYACGLSTRIGAYISSTPPVQAGQNNIPVTPQILSASTVNATTGWTLISGPYTSVSGGEEYITIGNFFDNASTTIGNGPLTVDKTSAYYFIDDICVTPQGGTGCGSFLPIELLSFTGNCTEQNTVQLHWSTATETNNDYFTVERSTDGINWEAAGNSASTRSYEFVDKITSQYSSQYYRLKQTDFDGKTETFNNKQVAVDVTECAVQVFPNPAGNTLNVPYVAEQDGEVTLEVYDVIGKLVKEKTVAATKGNNKFTLDLSTVVQGMYVLKVLSAEPRGGGRKIIRSL